MITCEAMASTKVRDAACMLRISIVFVALPCGIRGIDLQPRTRPPTPTPATRPPTTVKFRGSSSSYKSSHLRAGDTVIIFPSCESPGEGRRDRSMLMPCSNVGGPLNGVCLSTLVYVGIGQTDCGSPSAFDCKLALAWPSLATQ